MILRYLTYLFFQRFLMGFVGNIFIFPLSWMLRHKLHKGFLWWWLHEDGWFGDAYFQEKYNHKKTFWVAWMWAFRNPIHNFYYSRQVWGKQTDYKGWATCQRPDGGFMWRTLKTRHKDGRYADKYGQWIDAEKSILGIQWISFRINGKKYFRFSVARPVRIWKNLWWVPEWKFGFENTYWAEQFHPFLFKRFNGRFKYKKINL